MRNILLAALLAFSIPLTATHLRCGQISVKHLGNRVCRITVRVYTDSGSPVLFGGETDILDFGDGTSIRVPETPNTPLYSLGPDMATAEFTIEHTYSELGSYLISYTEANRNDGILNFDNSVTTAAYFETFITLISDSDNYQTPDFLTDPIFFAKVGTDFTMSIAAMDSNDYQLFYLPVIPKRSPYFEVNNYKFPGNFNVNSFNGLITWDTQFEGMSRVGEYLFSVRIFQYDGEKLIGYVLRDFQVILDDLSQPTPQPYDTLELNANNRIYISPDEELQFKVFLENGSNMSLAAYSELEHFPEAFSFDPNTGVVSLTNTPLIIRDNPYLLTIRGSHSNGIKLHNDLSYLIYTKDIEITELPPELFELPGVETIEVFPNPVWYILTIAAPEEELSQITIYDQSGRRVYDEQTSGSIELDMFPLPTGVYICHIQTKTLLRVIKVIKT